jgi:hypothetical protein
VTLELVVGLSNDRHGSARLWVYYTPTQSPKQGLFSTVVANAQPNKNAIDSVQNLPHSAKLQNCSVLEQTAAYSSPLSTYTCLVVIIRFRIYYS